MTSSTCPQRLPEVIYNPPVRDPSLLLFSFYFFVFSKISHNIDKYSEKYYNLFKRRLKKNTKDGLVLMPKLFRLPWKQYGATSGRRPGHPGPALDEIWQNRLVYILTLEESASASSEAFLIWQNYCHLLLLKLQQKKQCLLLLF